MICNKCNNEIPDDSKFCIKCGAKIPQKDSIIAISFGKKEIAIGIGVFCLVFLLGLLIGKGIGKKNAKVSKLQENTYTNNYEETYSNDFKDYELNEDEPIFEGLINFHSEDDDIKNSELCLKEVAPELIDGSCLTNLSMQFCDITVHYGMSFIEFEEAVNNSKMGFVMYGDHDAYEHPNGEPINSSSLVNRGAYLYKDGEFIGDIILGRYKDTPDVCTYADFYVEKIVPNWIDDNNLRGMIAIPGNISTLSCGDWSSNEALEYLKLISPVRARDGDRLVSRGNKRDNLELEYDIIAENAHFYQTTGTLMSVNGVLIPVSIEIIPTFTTNNKIVGFIYRYSPKYVKDYKYDQLVEEAKETLELAGYTVDDIYKIDNPRIDSESFFDHSGF